MIQPAPKHRQEAREIMRVEQRTRTDCLRCCLAMVTAIDYDDVPDFVADHGESWPTACEEWLSELGMGLLMMPTAPTYVPPWLPIIARASTEYSDVYHFVVVTPNAIIDPSPSQHKLKEAAATYAVVNSDSLANEFIGHLAKKYSAACSALSVRDREIRRLAFKDAIDALRQRANAYLGVSAVTVHEIEQCIHVLREESDKHGQPTNT